MNITATDSAIRRIQHLQESNDKYLRIAVLGGGCSGFQYKIELSDAPIDKDFAINEKNKAMIVIDINSSQMMDGAVIDFIEELGGSFFKIKNPNVASSCGCGNSFDLA